MLLYLYLLVSYPILSYDDILFVSLFISELPSLFLRFILILSYIYLLIYTYGMYMFVAISLFNQY